jgi:hypothetical protein
VGITFFLLHNIPDELWGTPSLLSHVYGWALSSGEKRLGREADYTPPSNAEVKNDGAIPIQPICIYGLVFD